MIKHHHYITQVEEEYTEGLTVMCENSRNSWPVRENDRVKPPCMTTQLHAYRHGSGAKPQGLTAVFTRVRKPQ